MVRRAHEAGAAFGVAPGFDPAVMESARTCAFPFCPGITTASELSQALRLGARLVKFFPAEVAGGVAMIKNLLGAFRFTGVKFMPTGGIHLANVCNYLAVPEIICCGGTWVAPKDAIHVGDWARIETLPREAAQLTQSKFPFSSRTNGN